MADTHDDATVTTEIPEELQAAMDAVRAAPEDQAAWDQLEDVAAQTQRPEDVASLFEDVLREDLSPSLADDLGQRAANFLEEWFGEESDTLTRVLTRVLDIVPTSEWAFQRLTVAHTMAGRWDDLLALYDQAISASASKTRRQALLDEAANVAKDFAQAPNRAIDYLSQLLDLRPYDTQLVSSLERLLERQGRWPDLVQLWSSRLEGELPEERRAQRLRIAQCHLDKLDQTAEALEQIELLVREGGDGEQVVEALEQIAGRESAAGDVRRGALKLLEDLYDEAGKPDEVVRVLEAALEYVGAEEKAALHREAGTRLIALERYPEAMSHFAYLLELVPTAVDAHQRLREMAGRTGDNESFASALEAAASNCEEPSSRVTLRLEAAESRRAVLGDAEGAISLYRKVLEESEAKESSLLQACRWLKVLLEAAGRTDEQLDVLERLAQLEPEPTERKSVLGRAAHLADSLEQVDRALGLWDVRISEDDEDIEALNATINILKRESRWETLVECLLKRATAPVSKRQSREDKVMVARLQAQKLDDVDAAIETWLEVQEAFGENDETINSLAELYAQANRWSEYADLLDGASARESSLVASMLARLGDVCRDELSQSQRAKEFYQRTLRIDPSNAEALAGLNGMLDDEEHRGEVAATLALAYESTHKWEELLGILGPRLETAPNDASRVRLYRETSAIQEKELEVLDAALESITEAMVLAPWDASLEVDALRLAEATGEWQVMTDALRRTAEVSTEDSRRIHLRFLEGKLAEQHLGDVEMALEAFVSVHAMAPARVDAAVSTMRTAAAADRWDRAAQAALACFVACDEQVPSVVATIEDAAERHGGWTPIAESFDRSLDEDQELSSTLGRQMDMLVGYWHEHHREDLDAAEVSLRRAVSREGGEDVSALKELARLQRRTPNRDLYETLMKLSDRVLSDDDIDALHEAAVLALETLDDEDLQIETLGRLYRESSRLWRSNVECSGKRTPEGSARWALDELVRIYEERGLYGEAVSLLSEGAQLPLIQAASLDMRRRAARIAAGPLEDHGRAMVLYRGILAETSEDEETIREFAEVCRAKGLVLELLSLLHQELELSEDRERRLDLRLEIAELIGRIESQGGRLEALRANLDGQPGHKLSIEALVKVHEDDNMYVELADLLTEQARLLESDDQPQPASELWKKVASLAEDQLRDVERALGAHRRVQKLIGSVESIDALARLQSERGEHAAAARWFDRRLQITEGDERLEVFQNLAGAHLQAGQVDEAAQSLAGALEEKPDELGLREKLADIYRQKKDWEPLAQLLTEAAPYTNDIEALRAYAHEAAEIYGRLGSPDKAIGVLEKAASLAQEDRGIRRMLAEALIAAGRLDEGRVMAEHLIADFGRRRNAERASVHYLLARALRDQGELHEALAQLELASKMDVLNTGVAGMLGQLARELGELDRAERTYKKLLMVVRRQPPEVEEAVGAAEVLYELHRLAKERGEDEQAEELLRSALQTASQTSSEARRFRRAMLARDDRELLMTSQQMRVEAAREGDELASALADQAEVLETPIGQLEAALEAWLKSLEQAPEVWERHDQARALALRMEQSQRYADALRGLVENLRREEEAELASALLMRLGAVLEKDLGDLEGAGESYSRVEALGVSLNEARVALARVAGARGETEGEARLLSSLIADDEISEATRSDCRYRLAEIQLASPGDAGLKTLEDALEVDALYRRAAEILQAATTAFPDDDQRLELYGKVSRASGSEELVLDFLEKRIDRPDASIDEAEQSVHILVEREEPERLEAVYRRASQIAETSEEGLAAALWAPLGVAERRSATGDLEEAAQWMAKAAEATADDEQAFELWRKAASLTAQAGDHANAIEIYQRLLERDPSDRSVWEPALASARALGDEPTLTALVDSTLMALTEPDDRNAVRVDHASFLIGLDGREPEAAEVLRAVLDEDPNHAQATEMLTSLYQRIGFDEDLADLLRKQLDTARDNQDIETIRELTLKLGELLIKIRREDSMDVYRAGLEWLPDDREIAQCLLNLLGPEDDPRERVELLERPLKNEEGEAAAALAISLADEWGALEDTEGVERVIRMGYEKCPENDEIRARLEAFFSQNSMWEPLAELMTSEARRLADPVASVALLRNAAAIYRDSLNRVDAGVESLALARTFAPDDVDLLHELSQHRKGAGQHDTAIEEVTEVIDRFGEEHASRTELLLLRSELHQEMGRLGEAVIDLEDAYQISGSAVAEQLIAGLEQLMASSVGEDPTTERSSTLRLVDVLLENGDQPRAQELLSQWLTKMPNDRDALYQLLQLDERDEQWEAVANTCEQLLTLEEGEGQVECVLKLADAWTRLEQPERARPGLERVFSEQPGVTEVRDKLWDLYEAMGAHHELATMLVAEALVTEDEDEKFNQLRRAGDLFLKSGPDGLENAIAPLEEAVGIKSEDHETVILLVDAYTSTERYAQAGQLLEQAIAARGTRRSRQLAELQHRMARLAGIAGDKTLQLQWLNVAFDSDRRNGDVVADLASLAMELGELDLALSALRVVTVSKVESPLTRAQAFLMQAQIANQKGEARRALMWAHRAHEEDPELVEASEFLELLGNNS